MSDAFCGPSNPLQNFQKHTQADRTLQQDRLTSRGSPAQGFRSIDPNAGALDPEFEAFQRSQAGPFTFSQPGPSTFQPPPQHFQQPAFAGPSNASDWAADFQRLDLHSPPPISQHTQAGPSAGPQAHYARLEHVASGLHENRGYQFDPGQLEGMDLASRNHALQNYQMQLMLEEQQRKKRILMARQEQDPARDTGALPQYNTHMFDDSAFAQAFDAAREEIFAEQDVGQDASKPTEKFDTGGVDIYPGLSLLRFSLMKSMMRPTEQSMHEAALYLSILETHDLKRMNHVQASMFMPILSRLADVKDYTFTNRYSLAERAASIRQQLIISITDDPQVRALNRAYVEQAQKSPINTYFSSQARVATDDEMRADLDMQMERLKRISPERRIFEVISQSHFANPETLTETDLRMLRLEAYMISNQYSTNPLTTSTQNYEEMLQDPANWLYSLSYHAVDLPEVVEAREHAQASNWYTNAPTPIPQSRPMNIRPDEPQNDQTQPQEQEPPQTNNDDLSRAAGELVDKLQTNTSSKFQNSSFLALMRRVRDKEIIVEGDQMIESGAASSQAKPDYIPPRQGNNPPAVNSNWHMTGNMSPVDEHASHWTEDVRRQQDRDGQDVIDLLSAPSTIDQEPEVVETAPFYDNQHAELGRRGLFET
ncbi:hypothetical protein MBLNU457_5673t1 [Dothideomycetes sp. NU457]